MVLVYSSWLADRALAGSSIGMVTSTWRDDLVSLKHRANLIQLSFQIDRGIVPFNFQNYLLSVGIIVTGLFLILYLVVLTSCGVAPFLGDHGPRTINSCFEGNRSKPMALQNTYLLEFGQLVLMMSMADRKNFAVVTFVGKAAAAATLLDGQHHHAMDNHVGRGCGRQVSDYTTEPINATLVTVLNMIQAYLLANHIHLNLHGTVHH